MDTLGKMWNAVRLSQLANDLGLGAIKLIQQRTREGIDVDGNRFKPYSTGYKKLREKAGLGTDIVNLKFSKYFGMLHEINHVVAQDLSSVSVLIDDTDKAEIAKYHNVMGAGKGKVIRKFWGLSPEEEKALTELTELEIQNVLKSL